MANDQSCQPCGCDPDASYVCSQHMYLPGKFPSPQEINDVVVCSGPTTRANPAFEIVLSEMRDLHSRKGHDYASNNNPFSNFEEAAAFAGVDVDTVFRVIIGIKIARLKELQGSGKSPLHESVDDSQMDLTMYGALRRAYLKRK